MKFLDKFPDLNESKFSISFGDYYQVDPDITGLDITDKEEYIEKYKLFARGETSAFYKVSNPNVVVTYKKGFILRTQEGQYKEFVIPFKNMEVFDTLDPNEIRSDIKAKALAKLTTEEKQILRLI